MPTASPCSLQALIRHTNELAGGKCRSPTVSVAGDQSLWRANGVTAADCCACGRSDRHPVQWIGEGASAGVASGRGGRGGWSTGDAAAAAGGCDETDAAAGCLGVSERTSLATFFRGGA
jgi:Zn ribbon nucleic-acid-binding protein